MILAPMLGFMGVSSAAASYVTVSSAEDEADGDAVRLAYYTVHMKRTSYLCKEV
jgi:hypothetical protein